MSEDDIITSHDIDGTRGLTMTRAQWRAWEERMRAAGWTMSPGNWDEVLSDDEAAKKTVWPTRVDLEYVSDLIQTVNHAHGMGPHV